MRNQGLVQAVEKFQGLQTWIFFQVYSINLASFLNGDLEKKNKFARPEFFLWFETDLDFRRPGLSEINVQIKRPADPSGKFILEIRLKVLCDDYFK